MEKVEFKKSTEHYDIIDSGSIIIKQGEHLLFEIANMTFDFLFAKDEIVNKVPGKFHMEVDNQNPNKLNITLYDVNGSFFGAPTNNMLELAQINSKPLYVSFAFQPINKNSETHHFVFFYTWYLNK